MNVGFIGLGQMGLPMAANLLKAGHRVTAYNRTRSRAEELARAGGAVAKTAGEACRGEALVTMLADDQAVEEVVLAQELVAELPHETVHISMSTLSVALSRRLAETHARSGRLYVSAPVLGRPDAARAAKLFIFAAGPARAVARSRPLFDAMGQHTFILGEDAPQANVVKLAANFLIASVIESLGEAFALVRKSGVEPSHFLHIITSTLFSAPVYQNYGRIIVEERFEPAGFKVPLGLKDVRLVLAAADAAGVPLPIANIVRDHLLTAMARGRQELDWSSLARVAAENAGL
jgi:3-hydroxyisobutyrate dehydrogenase-like beta-hydroxyacid dehydrogenase